MPEHSSTPAPFPVCPPTTVLTGASRGLGLGIARQLLAAGHRLLTLQRHPSEALDRLAQATGAASRLEQWSVDLCDPVPVAERLRIWVQGLGPGAAGAPLALVNNAALLATPGRLADADLAELSRATRVSTEAPLLLTAAFLGASLNWLGPRRVLNISSGLGRHAMAGAAPYCAAKAAIDHFSRAVALEEAEAGGPAPQPARIVSLAPGVIDTDMQVQLRSAPADRFSQRERFEQLKASGSLDGVDVAAAKVVAWLHRSDFGQEPIADVRQP